MGMCQEHWFVCPGSSFGQVGWENVNISILHLEIFQRHAGPKCRQSVMEASSQFYSDNKTLSESQFPGRGGDCQIVKLSSFIVLKPSYSKTLSVSDRQFHHECK